MVVDIWKEELVGNAVRRIEDRHGLFRLGSGMRMGESGDAGFG